MGPPLSQCTMCLRCGRVNHSRQLTRWPCRYSVAFPFPPPEAGGRAQACRDSARRRARSTVGSSRSILVSLVAAHGGRIINAMGDTSCGILCRD
jgi:hypothetical protein